MKYLWTEDTGARLHFWKLLNQLFFENAFVVESKESNQGILDALSNLEIKADDKPVEWTGADKTDKIKIREGVLSAIENHRINLSKIDDEKTLQYITGFKRYSTERVMKSLVGELTQNEKWSVKGALMGSLYSKDKTLNSRM